MDTLLKDNLAKVKERIAAALDRAGRPENSVTIIGVTKKFGPEQVEQLVRAGVQNIGENRIQEFLEKQPLVRVPCRWHLVGTLQRNKAAKAVGRFVLIHSVDSIRLGETLSRLSKERNLDTHVLIQVNTSGESTKHGFSMDETVDCAGEISELPNLVLKGLMTIGPLTTDETAIRRSCRELFELRAGIRRSLGCEIPELSMGMTDDYEIAVEEGATMVRLGRVLLGERPV